MFTAKSLGGQYDIYCLFCLLYLSDLKHLARYGSSITNDSYIALKHGPVPYNIYTIYKQLKGECYMDNFNSNLREFFSLGKNDELIAKSNYDEDFIAGTEAECIFETIKENKNISLEDLRHVVTDISWQLADYHGGIPLKRIVTVSGISNEMIDYIEETLVNEQILFNENLPTEFKAEGESIPS